MGERIREIRQEKDLSLRELATRIGVSAAFMSDVELGRRNPSDKHLEKVARVLETSLDDLQKYDTRPPLREFQRATLADPGYGVAFRQMLDRNISSRELLDLSETAMNEGAKERSTRDGNVQSPVGPLPGPVLLRP